MSPRLFHRLRRSGLSGLVRAVFGLVLLTAACRTRPGNDSIAPDSSLMRQGGTFAVAMLQSNQVVVAIDSRVTRFQQGRRVGHEDGVEKVRPLSSRVAFFTTGTILMGNREWTNSLLATAMEVAEGWKREGRILRIEQVAAEFKERVATDMTRLAPGDLYGLHLSARKEGSSNVFNAVFLGQDWDGIYRLFRLTCSVYFHTNTARWTGGLHFDLSEEKRTGPQRIFLYGAGKLIGSGFDDPKSPLAPAVRQIRRSRIIQPEPMSAALVDFAIRQTGDGDDSTVGYPIIVYVADKDGLRLSRRVQKGERVTFDSRDQGKP